MASDLVESAGWALRRHRLAVRGVLTVVGMVALAAALNAVWHTVFGNVIAGLLVVFAGALAVVMLVVGLSMAVRRLRRTGVH